MRLGSHALGLAMLALLAAVSSGGGTLGAARRDPPAEIEDLAIVVNRSNPVDSVSIGELRRLFLGEIGRWPHGRRVTIVMREPGTTERAVVLRAVCRMTEQDFRRHHLQLVFTGQAPDLPRQLATANGVLRFVFNVPGAIGYVRAGEVDPSVKVLQVQGRRPGQPGYGLKVPPSEGEP